MIEVKNLTKKYGRHKAVDDLSFTVEDGQIYGFLGPNGAGKSTTMNIMTGYIAPSKGTVIINGFDILKDPAMAKKSVGYLPEIPPLYMDMTVGEYLEFVAELKNIPYKERKEAIKVVEEKTQITDMHQRLIKNLSKGYRQRVGFAQAILGNPDVIILDEPMVGLDPKQIIEIRDLIKELGKSHTIILSSHILSEISAVCDHIMIISKGKLVASGSPEELVSKGRESMAVRVTFKGDFGKAEEIICGYSDLETALLEESQNFCTVEISTNTQRDIREDVFFAFCEKRIPILEMVSEKASLEELFLELTDETNKENEEPAEETEEPADLTTGEEDVNNDSNI